MKKSKRIKIDISDWDLADWPDALLNAVEINKTPYSIDIEITGAAFESAARKIIQEGLETYFRDANWCLDKEGLKVSDINYEREFVIPYADLLAYPNAEFEAWLNERRVEWKQWKKEEEEQQT